MSRRVPRRNAVAGATTLAAFSLGVTVAVLLAGPASALAPSSTTRTTTTMTAAPPTTTTKMKTGKTTTKSPWERYFVINATVNAASDHEVAGSSAFPNFAKGAVDNYYSLAHAHVDNSPSAEGRASPADTGPIGQTAAAGHAQQPQYADARWPGDPDKATYGNEGGPYAMATASEYRATAEASAASHGLNGTSASKELATPKGFDARLREALAGWKAKWQGADLRPKTPTPRITTPAPRVTTPTATVPTPTATVTTPSVTVAGAPAPAPPLPVPSPAVPSGVAPSKAAPTRSLSAANTAPKDGASLLSSTTLATLDPKTGNLVTSGESSLGRVSLGGGQIVIEKIHVAAAIENDGAAPTTKVAVTVGSASIGGVPVTIDQDGVHLADRSQGLPYRQASEALNGALKQAGIKLFLVAPEITTGASCGEPGQGADTPTTTTTSDRQGTTTTSTTSSCDEPPATTGATTTGATTTGACDPSGAGTGTGTTTAPAPTPAPIVTGTTGTTTDTTTGDQPGTTTATSSCGSTGVPATTSPCGKTGASTGPTTTSGGAAGAPAPDSSGAATVMATGLHVVFTQPVGQSGVPSQYAEHILGEVYMDSLAVPAGPIPKLDLSSSSCRSAGASGGTRTSGGASSASGGSQAGGSPSAAGGSAASGSLSPAASSFDSTSQPGSSAGGTSLPAAFASALRKPLWLLLAYLLWQGIVIGTGASLWNWGRGEAT